MKFLLRRRRGLAGAEGFALLSPKQASVPASYACAALRLRAAGSLDRITDRIIADLEQRVRPWMRLWSAEHVAGRTARPLRYNGIPYKGINVVVLWPAATMKGYSCPIWLTCKQALELGGAVRKGERGELVVYANSITRTGTDEKGEETERHIPFLTGYTVFNAEQCDGLLRRQQQAEARLGEAEMLTLAWSEMVARL